jgi:heme-degrading monooxygenase HmoA
MIARTWKGIARPDSADGYVRHLDEHTLPALAAIPGHLGACVLRRGTNDRVQFTVITLWESIDAIRRFAGSDVEVAVVPDEARALLVSFDDRVEHWEMVRACFPPSAPDTAE